ncbi:hypothetical protein GE09DRAFT_524829 [Coniochaeta sp. 2T2.1]|nr:hypothetical protein GE09DRAFT_524829 [Coniochaeta sp. 2T2.1]
MAFQMDISPHSYARLQPSHNVRKGNDYRSRSFIAPPQPPCSRPVALSCCSGRCVPKLSLRDIPAKHLCSQKLISRWWAVVVVGYLVPLQASRLQQKVIAGRSRPSDARQGPRKSDYFNQAHQHACARPSRTASLAVRYKKINQVKSITQPTLFFRTGLLEARTLLLWSVELLHTYLSLPRGHRHNAEGDGLLRHTSFVPLAGLQDRRTRVSTSHRDPERGEARPQGRIGGGRGSRPLISCYV